jgi:hypothetical protein
MPPCDVRDVRIIHISLHSNLFWSAALHSLINLVPSLLVFVEYLVLNVDR